MAGHENSDVDLHKNGQQMGKEESRGETDGNALTCEYNHSSCGDGQRDLQKLKREVELQMKESAWRSGVRSSEDLDLDCV